jgi:hypothetical protein
MSDGNDNRMLQQMQFAMEKELSRKEGLILGLGPKLSGKAIPAPWLITSENGKPFNAEQIGFIERAFGQGIEVSRDRSTVMLAERPRFSPDIYTPIFNEYAGQLAKLGAAPAQSANLDRPSVEAVLTAVFRRTPPQPGDKALDFNFTPTNAPVVPGLPANAFEVNVNGEINRVGSMAGTSRLPQAVINGSEHMGHELVKLMQKNGVDIRQTAEFSGFDVSKPDGTIDSRKVGALLLAAASVTRVGGRGGHPAIVGTNFDNALSYQELRSLANPLDREAIQSIANGILQEGVLDRARQAAQGAAGAGVQTPPNAAPIHRCPSVPMSNQTSQERGCGR